jgi:hypothetical protein
MSTLPFLLAAGLFAFGLIPVALTRLPEPELGEGGRLTIGTGRASYSWPAPELRTAYFEAIPRRMRAVATDRDGGA